VYSSEGGDENQQSKEEGGEKRHSEEGCPVGGPEIK